MTKKVIHYACKIMQEGVFLLCSKEHKLYKKENWTPSNYNVTCKKCWREINHTVLTGGRLP